MSCIFQLQYKFNTCIMWFQYVEDKFKGTVDCITFNKMWRIVINVAHFNIYHRR